MEKYVTVFDVVETTTVREGDYVEWHRLYPVPLEKDSLTYTRITSKVHEIFVVNPDTKIENRRLVTINPENRWILEEVLTNELSEQVNSLKKKVEEQRQEVERHIKWGDILNQEHASLHLEITELRASIHDKKNATLWQRIKWVFTGVR